MPATLSQGEVAQLRQTIEMFEVILQSQPSDYQSLEILKEAYLKLNMEKELLDTSRRIAQAYVEHGQLSSAILEYETILQRNPDDPEIRQALKDIEERAGSYSSQTTFMEPAALSKDPAPVDRGNTTMVRKPRAIDVNDGRKSMHKVFVGGKIITAGDFDLCWVTPDLSVKQNKVIDPFIQVLADKGVLSTEQSLKILSDKTRLGYLPLERYEIDMELARTFPDDTCRRWCVLPFDRLSKSVMVATVNPFNQQAAKELEEATQNRILWYLVPPVELVKNIQKVFRTFA